jgi:electron transfer flavoprotein alpha subunit
MDFAHFAIVADATDFLPALTTAFRRRLSVNRLAG